MSILSSRTLRKIPNSANHISEKSITNSWVLILSQKICIRSYTHGKIYTTHNQVCLCVCARGGVRGGAWLCRVFEPTFTDDATDLVYQPRMMCVEQSVEILAHDLTRARTRADEVGSRWLSAWTTVQLVLPKLATEEPVATVARKSPESKFCNGDT
jgi:hypothetical protein